MPSRSTININPNNSHTPVITTVINPGSVRYGVRIIVTGFLLCVLGLLIKENPVEAKSYPQAPYQVIDTLSNTIEIREYAPQWVADITIDAKRKEAANRGFRQLFSYISGNNQTNASVPMTVPVAEFPSENTPQSEVRPTSQKIPMTVPVAEIPADSGWTIRFFMPPSYTEAMIPKANNPDITISQLPPRLLAVIRFSGFGNNTALHDKTAELSKSLQQSPYQLAGNAQYAFYNAPFTLPFFRRNEVMIPVAHKPSSPSQYEDLTP